MIGPARLDLRDQDAQGLAAVGEVHVVLLGGGDAAVVI